MNDQDNDHVNDTGNRFFDLEGSSCFFLDSTGIKISRLLPYVAIIIVSVVGNSLVVVVVFRKRSMRKAVNFFIVNMALSDLLITVVYMPRVIGTLVVGYGWLSTGVAGQVFCKGLYFIHDTAVSVSILSAVSLSGERLIAVARPYKALTNTTKASRSVIVFTWFAAALLRFPVLLANKVRRILGKPCCGFFLDSVFGKGSSALYHQINLISMYAAPLLLMVTMYSATIVILKTKKRPGNVAKFVSTHAAAINQKVSKMIVVVLFAFLLCWLLYFISAVLTSSKIFISCNLLYVRFMLAHFNCALTPVLYALFCENYRREFKKVLFLCPLARRVKSASELSSSSGLRRAWVTDPKLAHANQRDSITWVQPVNDELH